MQRILLQIAVGFATAKFVLKESNFYEHIRKKNH